MLWTTDCVLAPFPFLAAVTALAASTALAAPGPTAIPAWRGKSPGTRWCGPDVLWRCREGMVFHLLDESGDGFRLDIDVRDMNTYHEGPRPVFLWVTGPNGATLAKELLPDDGITDGAFDHKDGIADVYLDSRYREWHRCHSPGGYPPGKSRSPLLDTPETLQPQTVSLRIPPAGKGLYRLAVLASWDHWVAVTPSRPLCMGVHPGPGPLYIHKDRLAEAYLYAPQGVQDIAVALTEEVAPYSWQVRVSDASGAVVGETDPTSFYTYTVVRDAMPDSVYRLSVTGKQAGAYLHLAGVPMVLCPDAESARAIHGGVKVDDQGRWVFHRFLETLWTWAKGLGPEDLAVSVDVPDPDMTFALEYGAKGKLGDVAHMLATQILRVDDPAFGTFATPEDGDPAASIAWRNRPEVLAQVAAWDRSENPYYGHPALVRRILLYHLARHLSDQAPHFWFTRSEGPKRIDPEPKGLWNVALRSNWYPMHDGHHASSLRVVRRFADNALPATVLEAWRRALRNWTLARTLMRQGECSNQWAVGIDGMKNAMLATGDYELREAVEYQIRSFCSPGSLGRTSPDRTPYTGKSSVGYGGVAADTGRIGGGVPSDGLGHDAEYCLESELHMGHVWEALRSPEIEEWLNDYYDLKTHMTLPKGGGLPGDTFSDTCCPTDFNARTRYYTHKTPLPKLLRERVRYGDIWVGATNADYTWPCLEKGTFLKNIDNRYYFVKTSAYYAIVYAGPASCNYGSWIEARRDGNSFRLVGYGGMHYGGYQRSSTKLGGISAVWVPNCGPTFLCQNHNVNYSNGIWGRRKTPICARWTEHHVDPFIVCEGFNSPDVQVDEKERTFVKRTDLLYAPLSVTRTIRMADAAMDVLLVVDAFADVELTELYEALPYFADNRAITLYDERLADPAAFDVPPGIDGSGRGRQAEKLLSGENPDLPDVRFRGVDVAAASGAGSIILFDQALDFSQTQPLKYRSVAAHTGAFNLKLKTAWEKGDRATIHYRIIPHAAALTAVDVQGLATGE